MSGDATLFEAAGLSDAAPRPLADRLRPRKLDDVVGQDRLLGAQGPLSRMARAGRLPSLILWGPPGSGKTTIARLLADQVDLEFTQLSAIFSGVADLRKVFDRARQGRAAGRGALLFIDEIHRFNKAQQDSFLPHMENGLITLVGATTENPSFALNGALLSRAQVLTLDRLDDRALEALLQKAETHLERALPLTDEARALLRAYADGDGRALLNLAEEIFDVGDRDPIDVAALGVLINRRALAHDRADDGHYALASALQKSVRGSDVDAALYWGARMLQGGEDPRFVLRRLIVFASEDIGNADPQALGLAIAAKEAYEFLGQPEGEIAIGQLIAYLASAPKSNRAHVAFKSAKRSARENGSLAPPPHAVNAPTRLMRELGAGAGYQYDHDQPGAFSGANFFPEGMAREQFYEPREEGAEKAIAERLRLWREARESKTS